MLSNQSRIAELSRRKFVRSSLVALPALAVGRSAATSDDSVDDDALTTSDIEAAERLAGLSFSDDERDLMLEDLAGRLEEFAQLREHEASPDIPPALVFDPRIGGESIPRGESAVNWGTAAEPGSLSDDDLAFAGVAALGEMIRTRAVSARSLTELFIRRLRRFDSRLQAVVTVTEERALEQADRADREIAAGQYRGPLHGIPYGAKDLLSARRYPTTWGATPYRDQVIDEDAAVIERLDEAGAVLVAKLTLGALAWGDVWFGGKTRNPWNLDEGSSGSSAGPGSAVSAGLVPFAIGSETYGSIVSPSTRNGVTGHRPTFGLVSRSGAMALSWSMDKLGPMCRSALDCAIVFDTIRGADPRDPATVDAPFIFDASHPVRGLRVGYVEAAFKADYENQQADNETLRVLREELAIDLQPVDLPVDLPIDPMLIILSAEAATAFDGLTRSRGIDSMVRQERNAWPNVFRASRFIPAVEYLQANRIRSVLLRRMANLMKDFDVIVSPAFEGKTLALTNLTGHPAVCVPNAFHSVEGNARRKSPGSVTFLSGLYRDGAALALAHAYQQATDFHLRRPPVI